MISGITLKVNWIVTAIALALAAIAIQSPLLQNANVFDMTAKLNWIITALALALASVATQSPLI